MNPFAISGGPGPLSDPNPYKIDVQGAPSRGEGGPPSSCMRRVSAVYHTTATESTSPTSGAFPWGPPGGPSGGPFGSSSGGPGGYRPGGPSGGGAQGGPQGARGPSRGPRSGGPLTGGPSGVAFVGGGQLDHLLCSIVLAKNDRSRLSALLTLEADCEVLLSDTQRLHAAFTVLDAVLCNCNSFKFKARGGPRKRPGVETLQTASKSLSTSQQGPPKGPPEEPSKGPTEGPTEGPPGGTLEGGPLQQQTGAEGRRTPQAAAEPTGLGAAAASAASINRQQQQQQQQQQEGMVQLSPSGPSLDNSPRSPFPAGRSDVSVSPEPASTSSNSNSNSNSSNNNSSSSSSRRVRGCALSVSDSHVLVPRPFSVLSRMLAMQTWVSIAAAINCLLVAPHWLERLVGLLHALASSSAAAAPQGLRMHLS